ncbi:hypothetical protein GGX14DRAFT_638075 [Mycena pura]|uniref:Uncharacterized protein n=1 Tax=Mycena pura TaxID=153505 RepID=A0AAD7E2J0_9AGAR|nr:hypothetical protein GGX14DRAFT_638075 [Mycena pura]
MDVPMPPVADFEDDGTGAAMDAPSLARGLRDSLGDNTMLNAQLQESLKRIRTYLLRGLTGPLREALVQNGVLRPFHDYADQAIYVAGSDPFSFIASLWILEQNMLPTANIHDDLAGRLRRWLPQEENLDDGETDLWTLRRIISRSPRPEEPLLGAIFFEGQLKYFTNTGRDKTAHEAIYEHIAALWEPGSTATTPKRDDAKEKAAEEAFQRSLEDTFVGDGAEMFKKGMTDYHVMWKKYDSYYGRIVALVAPHGLGKTRVMLEYVKEHVGLYICLRKSDETVAHDWPRGDTCITQILEHADQPYLRCAAVLAALMDCAADAYSNLKSLVDHNQRWKQRSGSEPSRNLRDEILKNVARKALVLIKSNQGKFDDTSSTALECARKAANSLCAAPAARLATSAPNFVFCVDECTSFRHLYPPGHVSPLLQVMECLSSYSVWFILATTSSRIVSIVPSMEVKASQRLMNMKSLAPWLYLPFDPFVAGRALPSSLGAALRLDEFRFYGRPLWRVYHHRELLGIAVLKLLCGSELAFDENNLSEAHTFALFTQRICLQLSPSAASQAIEVSAVESHMRLATGVHAGRLLTACPSEPILALAAAHATRREIDLKNATQSLIDLVFRYRVDRGLEGELYSRLILILARDMATINGLYDENSQALRPVTLRAMLQKLVRSGYAQLDLKLRDTISSPRLSKLGATVSSPLSPPFGSDVHVNYTHFVELAAEVAVLDAQWCFEMWCRGAAAQCVFTQPVIDGFIIGYRGKLDEPFDETKFYLIAWQTKARQEPVPNHWQDVGLTCPLIRYKSGTVVKPDHTILHFDLGAGDTKYRSSNSLVKACSRAAVPTTRWGGYAEAHGVDETEGFFVGIRGLTPYAVLDNLNHRKLLLSINPEGPLEAKYGSGARASYDRLTHGEPQRLR